MTRPILLIEDDDDLRRSTAALLEDFGHAVVQAAGGAQAVGLLDRQRLVPSVVLLDYLMPGMSGAEVFDWIRTRPELIDVPVLLLTGAAQLDLPPPVTAVLRKPVRPDRLLAVVDALCGNSAVGRAENASRARQLRMGGKHSSA